MLFSYGYRCSDDECGKKSWDLLPYGTEGMHIEICECGKRMDLIPGKDNSQAAEVNDKRK